MLPRNLIYFKTNILAEGIPGLEVLNDNGIYVPAPPIEHSFIVNTGAYFELLSNSIFPATVHRVRTNVSIIPSAVLTPSQFKTSY